MTEQSNERSPAIIALVKRLAGEMGMIERNEKTSKEIASIAARGMADPASLTHDEIKRVCASAVTQAG